VTTQPPETDVVARFEDVTKIFYGPTNVLAVKEASFQIQQGDFVSIMGPSGSGKSTLLNLLGLLDAPTVGRYELAGVDTAGLSDRARSGLRGAQLGFVFQAFHLLARRTVFENVVLGMAYSPVPRRERAGRARQAIEQMGLGHRAGFFPATLSGGERQRVALARAVAAQPSLLLADEPTGNLDRASAHQVLGLLEQLNGQGITIAVVTHDPQVAAVARRRFTMSDGHIAETTP